MRKNTYEELIKRYKETDVKVCREEVVAELIEMSKPMFNYYSIQFSNIPNADEEDKHSVMMEALLSALDSFNVDMGVGFKTFLSRCLEQKLIKLYTKNTRAKRVVVDEEGSYVKNTSYESMLEEGQGATIFEGEVDCEYSNVELNMLLDSLDLKDRERYICEKFAKGWSSSEIAKSLEVAPSNITYFVKKLRKKLAPIYNISYSM